MSRVTRAWVVLIAVVAGTGAMAAHHSLAQFDTATPVWVKGTVVRFDRVNPHSLIYLDQTTADGRGQRWAVDGPAPNALARMGITADFLKAGDVIDVCGFVMKPQFEKVFEGPSATSIARPISGHLLGREDGTRRIWNDYGVLEKCLTPGEDKDTLRRESDRDWVSQAERSQ